MYIGLYYLLFVFAGSQGVIVEKQKSVCNDHCSILQLHCPRSHRIAIREALYGVHAINSVCPVTMDCSDPKREICCEMVDGRDCLFPYPLDHFNSFHTNCSGNLLCSVEMDLKQAASSACSTQDHRNVSSYSLIDYVCVNDTFTADICSEKEVTVVGRTLFAIFNPRDYSTPMTNVNCTCTARSNQRRITTNYISSFAVDLRLTAGSACSDAQLFMTSGGQSHDVDCMTSSGDSGFLYPFVSILNSTGDSMAKLAISKNKPDFVWIGFEGSFEEDIVLSCKRDNPPVNTKPDDLTNRDGSAHIPVDSTPNQHVTPHKPPDKTSPAGIAIGAVLGLVVIAVVALVVLWIVRRKSKKDEKSTTANNQNQNDTNIYAEAEDDSFSPSRRSSELLVTDVTYSTVNDITSVTNAYAIPWEFKKSLFDRKSSLHSSGVSVMDEDSLRVDSDGFEDIYITPEQVRRNKYLKKQLAAEMTEAIGDVGEEDEYVSVEEIKRNKRALNKTVSFKEKPDDYDKLQYHKKSPVEPPSGYSKLDFFSNKGLDSDDGYCNAETGSTAATRISVECDSAYADSTPPTGHSIVNKVSVVFPPNNVITEDNVMYANSKRDSDYGAINESNSPYELAKSFDNVE